MTIEILDQAELDLLDGFHFYEDKEAGLGAYFGDYADQGSSEASKPKAAGAARFERTIF